MEKPWPETLAFNAVVNEALGDIPTHPVKHQDKLRAVLRELAETAYQHGAKDQANGVVKTKNGSNGARQ